MFTAFRWRGLRPQFFYRFADSLRDIGERLIRIVPMLDSRKGYTNSPIANSIAATITTATTPTLRHCPSLIIDDECSPLAGNSHFPVARCLDVL